MLSEGCTYDLRRILEAVLASSVLDHALDAVRGLRYFSVSMASNGDRAPVANVAHASPKCIAILNSSTEALSPWRSLVGTGPYTLFQGIVQGHACIAPTEQAKRGIDRCKTS